MDESLTSAPITAHDVARILRRRALIVILTFVLVCAAVAYLTKHMRTVYEAEATILLDTPAAGNGISGDLAGLIGHAANATMETEVAKIQSRSFLLQIIHDANLGAMQPEDLRNRIILSAGPGGQILDIVVRTNTAAQAQRIANTVSDDYIKMATQEFYDKTSYSKRRLEIARDDADKDKAKAEEALHRFTAGVGTLDPEVLYSRAANRTVDVRMALSEAQKNLPLQQEQLQNYQQAIKSIPSTLVSGYTLDRFQAIQNFQNQIAELQTARKDKLTDFAPDSDEVKQIDAQIVNRQQAMADAEKNAYSKGSQGVSRNGDYANLQSKIYDTQLAIKSTQQNIVAWTRQLASLEDEQKRMGPQKLQYEGLRRARDDANDAYEKARMGLIQLGTSQVTSIPYIHPLDTAQLPPAPISPKPLLNGIMAVFLGLFLGVMAALIAEYLSGGFNESIIEHLPSVGGIPLLGSLPFALPAPMAAPGAGDRDLPVPLHASAARGGMIEDALREIGYCLTHRAGPKDPVPVVLLTSVRGDDSTATLTAQLTATLVRDGIRVTLIDADRDNPRLNHFFGAPDAPGLAEVLAKRQSLRDAMHVGANGALRFLAAGSPDDHSPASAERLGEIFRELTTGDATDVVFVSGPAVWNARQIAPLEKAARGMVLLTFADGGSPDESVARVRRLLSNGYKPDILGVVVAQGGAPQLAAASVMPAVLSNDFTEGEESIS